MQRNGHTLQKPEQRGTGKYHAPGAKRIQTGPMTCHISDAKGCQPTEIHGRSGPCAAIKEVFDM
jgi:hypothetical protein